MYKGVVVMKHKSFFWASYADLMTSLFFIMLVMFVLTTVMLKRQVDESEKNRKATEKQMEKIKEIENAVNEIDKTYFEYNQEHKKHILKIDVSFSVGSSNMENIPLNTRLKLLDAGNAIKNFISTASQKYGVKYLLIVEGQASKDDYQRNYELSYERALALVEYWEQNRLFFNKEECELIISGSGQSGSLRVEPDIKGNTANQRFLIHIIPKPGIIEQIKLRSDEK